MKTSRECVNIGVDARVPFLERAKEFESRGMKDLYPEALALQDAEEYEDAVLYNIDVRLAGRKTGRALLTAILAARPKIILIRPIGEISVDSSGTVAFKTPTAKGWDPMTGREKIATGGYAVNSLITYSPAALDGSDQAPPGMRDDEVLLHEMVHGLRDMRGQHSITAMSDGYDTVEEFMAILVSNIYASEVGRPLRGGHGGMMGPSGRAITPPLDPALTDPKRFLAYKNFRQYVEQFEKEHPTLASMLKTLTNIKFNPIAALSAGSP